MSKARYRFRPLTGSRMEEEYDDEFPDSPLLRDLVVYSSEREWEDTGLVTAEGVPIQHHAQSINIDFQ